MLRQKKDGESERKWGKYYGHKVVGLLKVVEQQTKILIVNQWKGFDPNENGDVCPSCHRDKKPLGHLENCEYAAAIKAGEDALK